jgi:multiple sugar transport system permease protein
MKRRQAAQIPVLAILALLIAATLIPYVMTLLISQKPNAEIYTNFWSLPREPRPEFYTQSFRMLWPTILNSLIVSSGAAAGVVILASMSGYAFARLRFAGKDTLYVLLLALLMVPGILTLIPLFQWMLAFPLVGGNDMWGRGGTGFRNSWLALWIPYWAGGQIFGLMLCRTFFEDIPREFFEAARVDGASEFRIYRLVVLPMSLPILSTLAIMQFIASYNDYIWPLVIISEPGRQMFAVGITLFAMDGTVELGPQMAGYVVGSLPLVILFFFGMKYYVQGLTSGGIKS